MPPETMRTQFLALLWGTYLKEAFCVATECYWLSAYSALLQLLSPEIRAIILDLRTTTLGGKETTVSWDTAGDLPTVPFAAWEGLLLGSVPRAALL